MAKPLVIAHLSDPHVSTYGETFHDRAHFVRRGAAPARIPEERFDLCFEQDGWRLLRERAQKPESRRRLRLIDPEGYEHGIPPPRRLPGVPEPAERAALLARALHARRATTLSQRPPDARALDEMLRATPHNTNLRLLRAAQAAAAAEADVVLLTGDLTDDGDGYEVVEAAFSPWRAGGCLLAVPGNHDLYLFPLAGSGRPRPTHKSKRARWEAFAAGLGLTLDETGAWVRAIPEGEAVVVGLDSCSRAQRRFFRHNGVIGPGQLDFLRRVAQTPEWRGARHRVVALHHHVVSLAHGVGGRAPSEIGMRLDDARQVAAVLDEVAATLVLHGHRHVSEWRQPAGCNFQLLAAPSVTLGCKSGDAPSFWRIELGERAHPTRVRLHLPAVLDQDGRAD